MMTTAALTDHATLLPPRQPVARRLAEVLLIVLVFFTLAGDPPPHVNESHYLSRMKHFWNPAWCAGDFFLESTDTQVSFIWLFGWITQWVSLPATAWIGRLFAWTLLAWSWQRLSWRLAPMPLASVLSAALFVTLNSQAHLAGEWIVGGVEAKCFAYGFVLLALSDLVDRRWNWMWLLLGAATAFHPLVGGWSAVVCGSLWLLEEFNKLKKGDRSIFVLRGLGGRAWDVKNGPVPVLGLVGGGLLALVGILPALSLTWNEPADLVVEASRIYVFERLPHHLALLSLPGDEMTRRVIRHALLLIALAGLGIAVRRHAIFRMVQFAWGAALLAGVGLMLELAFSHQPLFVARLLRYYWYRLTDFAAPLAVALAATVLISAALAQRKAWADWALVAAMAFAGWQLASVARERVLYPVPPADARMADFSAWVDACDWIAKNTPADALFLTPRMNHSFKWRTGRPEVVNRKDIPQDARGIVEWHRRINDIYYYEDTVGMADPVSSLSSLGTERVRELAKTYRAGFVLTDRAQLLSLPRAYWNQEYVVYRVE